MELCIHHLRLPDPRPSSRTWLGAELAAAPEPAEEAPPAPGPARAARGFALSQLDDWLHRGDDAIVRDMNLYVYSMWVYRVEKNLTATSRHAKATQAPAVQHVEMEF